MKKYSFIIILLAAALLAARHPAQGAEFFVSPTGTPQGEGSIASPWDLQTALQDNTSPANANSVVKPGDTIWLRGGTYFGCYVSSLKGAPEQPIILGSFPGEQAVIDANKVITLLADMAVGVPYQGGMMTVSNVSGLSPGSNLKIEDEYVVVYRINGNTLSVWRGWGTEPVVHSAGAKVLITGDVLTINGHDAIYRDLIVTNSNPVRAEDRDAKVHGGGFDIFGAHVKVINNIIHDAGQGIGFWVQAVDSEVYGNLIFNNGYQNTDLAVGQTNWINGHGIYMQNDQGMKTVSDNIIFNQFGLGMHAYSTNSTLNNFLIKGNIHFNDRFLLGGLTPFTNSTVEENYFYNGPLAIGYRNADNSGIMIKNNYLPDGLSLQLSKNVTVTGNTVWESVKGTNAVNVSLIFDGTNNQVSDYTFSNNTYYHSSLSSMFYPYHQFSVGLLLNGCGSYFWFNKSNKGFGYGGCANNSWQEDLGYDKDSTLILTPPPDKVFVRPNKYDARRAHVIIYNWSLQDKVTVDLSGLGFKPGDAFVLRNAQNYLNEFLNVTSDANNKITVSMTGWTIAEPIGSNDVVNSGILGKSTFPRFGVFVLIKTIGVAFSEGDLSANGAVTAYDAALALQQEKTALEAAQIAQRAVGHS